MTEQKKLTAENIKYEAKRWIDEKAYWDTKQDQEDAQAILDWVTDAYDLLIGHAVEDENIRQTLNEMTTRGVKNA